MKEIKTYSLSEFVLTLYKEFMKDDEEIDTEYAHCDIWLNGKSIQLHICDGED